MGNRSHPYAGSSKVFQHNQVWSMRAIKVLTSARLPLSIASKVVTSSRPRGNSPHFSGSQIRLPVLYYWVLRGAGAWRQPVMGSPQSARQ